MLETGCKSRYYWYVLEIQKYLQSVEHAYTEKFF